MAASPLSSPRTGFGALVRDRWQALQPRERRLVSGAAVVLGLALAWSLLLAPALEGRARLARTLPALQSQLAQAEALAAELSRGGPAATGRASPAELQAALRLGAAESGLAEPESPAPAGDRIELRFKDVAWSAWLIWLDSSQRALRLRPEEVRVTRREAGRVDAVVVFATASEGPR